MVRLLTLVSLVVSTVAAAQAYPPDVQPLVDKMRSGQQLTPEEQARFRDAMISRSNAATSGAMQKSGAPSDVQAIMQKAQSGQPLSAAEQQKMKDWATQRGASAAKNAAGAASNVSPEMMDIAKKKQSGQELTPAEKQQLMQMGLQKAQKTAPSPGVAGAMGYALQATNAVPTAKGVNLSKRKRMTQTQYIALLMQVVNETTVVLGPDWKQQLDKAMGQDPKMGRSLGVLLTFSPAGPAPSAYTLASSALLNPIDAQQASNVGVALYNANYFERAYDVLGYADGLKPHSPTILSNRGYAAMYLGDLKTAQSLFEAAVKAGGKMPDAHVGLALIGKATGNQPMMMAAAGAAVAEGSGSFVDQAMESSSTATESQDQRAEDTPLADQAGGSVGGVVYDLTGASGNVDWPVWTIPTEPNEAYAYIGAYTSELHKDADTAKKLGDQLKAIEDAYVQAQQAKAAQAAAAGGIYYPRRSPRILIILGDLQAVYDARLHKELVAWEKSYTQLVKNAPVTAIDLQKREIEAMKGCPPPDQDPNNYCTNKVEYEFCEQRHTQAREYHAAAGESYGQHVAKARDLVKEFWKKSDPYFQGIADPQVSKMRGLERDLLFYKYLVAVRAEVPGWLGSLANLVAGKCHPPPPPDPAKVQAINKSGNTPDAGPGQCIPPPGKCGLGPVNAKWDCNGFTVQGGEGLFGGVSVKFAGAGGKGTLSGHTETTVFAGFGDELAAGSASGEAKAVISFTQAQGQVVDVGAEYSTSASASGYGSKMEAGMDLTWSMRSGPDMSASAEASWEGTSIGSAKL